jgi:hypothetical protein
MDRLVGARLKVERAKKHIRDLHTLFLSIERGEPCTVASRDDLQTQERTYYVERIKEVPPDFSIIAGDALQNLRSALDHLIHQAIFKETGSRPTKTSISFPIGKNSKEYPPPKFGGRVEGLGEPAIKLLTSLKTYKGGNDGLWRLHSLNNLDKHRLLIPAFTNVSSHRITSRIRNKMMANFMNPLNSGLMPQMYRVNVAPEAPDFPLQEGSVLLTVPIAELEDDMQFTFDIAFNEAGLGEGEVVVDALRNMEWNVSMVIDVFDKAGLL